MAPATWRVSSSSGVSACHQLRFAMMVAAELFPQLLGAFIGEIGAADHQQPGDRPRREGREEERGGEQDQQLVADAAERDLADDRQLAVGAEADDIIGGDGGIVDDDPRGLGAGLDGGGADVVERRRRELGERRDVVEQGDESGGHERRLADIGLRRNAVSRS